MTTIRRVHSAALLLVLATVTALAADITGQWKAEFTTPDGSARQSTLTFKQEGEKLTGTVASTRGEAQIQEGKASGDSVSFFVIRNFGGDDVKLNYKGVVSGSEIKFKVSAEGGDFEYEMTAKKV